ncbi:MAG: zinc ABC transporter substrate-binding protein [Clostridiales bacterium]|nr:zinc ABC transporter substrate-binding protein [Clostridiales bacterium]
MKKVISILIIFSLILIMSACQMQTSTDYDKLTVVVSVVPQGTFVKKIAGDLVEVVTIIPPGNSPANYQPSAREMGQLSNASIYFTLEMPTEKANILPKVTDFNSDITIINLHAFVAKTYPMLTSGHDDHEGEDVDPHIWLSPKRAILMVQEMAKQLGIIDPENKLIYEENVIKYIEEINNVDKEIIEITSKLETQSFLIYHGSYTYFANDYNLEMIAIEIEGKQATASDLQKVIDIAREKNIKTIFYQEEFDDQQANTIAFEIDGSVMKAAPLSPNYIESLLTFANALTK